MLSINSFGEAVDVLWLLKMRILQRQHFKILAQVCLAVIFSATALASGPIARYATKRDHQIVSQQVPGLIAVRRYGAILNAPVTWNETITSLDQAKFPYNKLLDYLPDPTVSWVYNPNEWNSTWALDCNKTEKTPITLEDTGNCTSILHELLGLEKVISPSKYDLLNISNWWNGALDEGADNDVLLGIAAAKMTVSDDDYDVNYEMVLDLAAVHMQNLSIQTDSSSDCIFGKGPVESASYTKIECLLKRTIRDPTLVNIAYPDSTNAWLVSRALVQHYFARFSRESTRTGNFTVITPLDLMRFLQVWVATKDTMDGYSVPRFLSVRVPVVQLSTAFLAVLILIFLLIIVAMGSYIIKYFRNKHAFEDTPQSKLEWMLKVVQAADSYAGLRSPLDTSSSSRSGGQFGPSRLDSVYSSAHEKAEKRRTEFENARYISASSILDESSAEALTSAQSASAVYHIPPTEWQLPPLTFGMVPKKPTSLAYTSISEIQSSHTENEGERLVSKGI